MSNCIYKNNQEGVALMMVLWVMVLMAAIVTEFSYSMRTEINSTRNFKEEMESRYLAESGIELAIAEILEEADFHSINRKGQFIFGRVQVSEAEKQDEAEEKIIASVPGRIGIPLGAGSVSYRIVDENRKINVNTASKVVLSKILERGEVNDEDFQDDLSDAILDWIDKNDLHRLNGAENNYYQNLSEPYNCKNDTIDTLEEMLLIKGMTPEIFYGTRGNYLEGLRMGKKYNKDEKHSGINSLLTVQKTGTVNPNTASREVLEAFYPSEKVEEILEYRESEGFYDFSRSTHFTIYSLGQINESGIKHLIVATIQAIIEGEQAYALITYWNDNEDPQKYYDLFNQNT